MKTYFNHASWMMVISIMVAIPSPSFAGKIRGGGSTATRRTNIADGRRLSAGKSDDDDDKVLTKVEQNNGPYGECHGYCSNDSDCEVRSNRRVLLFLFR